MPVTMIPPFDPSSQVELKLDLSDIEVVSSLGPGVEVAVQVDDINVNIYFQVSSNLAPTMEPPYTFYFTSGGKMP